MVIIVILFIVGASTFIGWQIKNFYVQRNKFFHDQVLFCEIILNETNFNKTPLKHIITKNEKQFHKEFLKAMDNFEKSLDCGEDYADRTLILNKHEKEQFQNFLNSLGKTDLQNHNNIVGAYKQNIANKISKEMEEEKKKGNAIFKISICFGLALVVLCL